MSPKELEGDVAECPQCQWFHRPSQKCPKSKPPTKPLGRPVERGPERSVSELTAGFRNWEERAKEQPTTYGPTDLRCPGCRDVVYRATNFLGAQFYVVGEAREPLDEHQAHCQPPVVQALPTLQAPRRAGLPYKDPDE